MLFQAGLRRLKKKSMSIAASWQAHTPTVLRSKRADIVPSFVLLFVSHISFVFQNIRVSHIALYSKTSVGIRGHTADGRILPSFSASVFQIVFGK